MSKSSSSKSGLKNVTRDWSEHGKFQSSDYQPIDRPPTRPKPTTAAEKRLKLIQQALACPDEPPPKQALTDVSSGILNNKRLTSVAETDLPPAKKPRQLPWDGPKEDTARSLSAVRQAISSSSIPPAAKVVPVTESTAPTSSKTATVAKVFLSAEQTHILGLVQNGESVFYTGSAGTGKSVLLKEIIKAMRRKHVKTIDAVAITASTGIAACNIGGVTIHSFAGIGLGCETAEVLVQKVKKNKKACARWLRTKVLIIDEVSMIDGDLFDKLCHIGSALRKNSDPFGGIQVIVTGDFFQLPPVGKGSASVKFAFEAEQWSRTIRNTFNLTKVFRQRDEEFVNMLNEMRFGRLTIQSTMRFKYLSREIIYEDGLGATELFPRREDVDRSNAGRMSRLHGKVETFDAIDGGSITDREQRAKLLGNCMAPARLELRIDAQVMLIKNTDEELVNGSMGKVIQFVDPASYGKDGQKVLGGGKDGKKASAATLGSYKTYPVVEFLLPNGSTKEFLVLPEIWKVELPNGEVQASRSQVPLILSWAMSIHKSQGQTLERVRVDLGRVFEKGQAYVALSRATCLDGLQVLNFDPNKVRAHPKVVEWSKTLESVSE